VSLGCLKRNVIGKRYYFGVIFLNGQINNGNGFAMIYGGGFKFAKKRIEKKTGKKSINISDLVLFKNFSSVAGLIIALGTIITSVFLVYSKFIDIRASENNVLFLVDTSAEVNETINGVANFAALRQAVITAQIGISSKDSTGLRFFGGKCDESGTRVAIKMKLDNSEKILEALKSVVPFGRRPFNRGIVEATADFSDTVIKAGKIKRIVAITTGDDNCSEVSPSSDEVIKRRIIEAGLKMDYYVIGFRVPVNRRKELEKLAVELGGRVSFPTSVIDLNNDIRNAANTSIKKPLMSHPKAVEGEITSLQAKDDGEPSNERIAELLKISGLETNHSMGRRSSFFENLLTNLDNQLPLRSIESINSRSKELDFIFSEKFDAKNDISDYFLLQGYPLSIKTEGELVMEYFQQHKVETVASERKYILEYFANKLPKMKTPFSLSAPHEKLPQNQFTSNYLNKEGLLGNSQSKLHYSYYETRVLYTLVTCMSYKFNNMPIKTNSIDSFRKVELDRKCEEELNIFGQYNDSEKQVLISWVGEWITANSKYFSSAFYKTVVDFQERNASLECFVGHGKQGNPRAAFEAAEKLRDRKPIRSNEETYFLYRFASLSGIRKAQSRLIEVGLDPK
jgi:hypothetical protein